MPQHKWKQSMFFVNAKRNICSHSILVYTSSGHEWNMMENYQRRKAVHWIISDMISDEYQQQSIQIGSVIEIDCMRMGHWSHHYWGNQGSPLYAQSKRVKYTSQSFPGHYTKSDIVVLYFHDILIYDLIVHQEKHFRKKIYHHMKSIKHIETECAPEGLCILVTNLFSGPNSKHIIKYMTVFKRKFCKVLL
eukprot:304482_1